MITPYLEAKQGWKAPAYLHDDLRPILGQTRGVVVFHEQVIEIIAQFAGVTYAEADETRRALGDVEGMAETKLWFFPRALGRGYSLPVVEADLEGARGVRVVRLLQGPRRGVRAADLPVGLAQDALAGALPRRRAHPRPGHVPQAADPRRRPPVRHRGARPRRQRQREDLRRRAARLGEARQAGRRPSLRHPAGAGGGEGHQRGRGATGSSPPGPTTRSPTSGTAPGCPGRSSSGWCWPAGSTRSTASGRRSAEACAVAARSPGATCCSRSPSSTGTPGRSSGPAAGRGLAGRRVAAAATPARARRRDAAARNSTDPATRERRRRRPERHALADRGRLGAGRRPVPGHPRRPPPVTSVQLTLDLGDEPGRRARSAGCRRWTPRSGCGPSWRSSASTPAATSSTPTPSSSTRSASPAATTCCARRSKAELLVAGVKVATQTPPIRSGRRVIFLTLDDATGPVDATFFEDAQGPYAATVFHSWLLVVRGELRRTGRRGVSLRATGCWELPELFDAVAARRASRRSARRWPWCPRASPASVSRRPSPGRPRAAARAGDGQPAAGPATGPTSRTPPPTARPAGWAGAGCWCTPAASRCRRTPTSSRPARTTKDVARKLWHRSPGSAG